MSEIARLLLILAALQLIRAGATLVLRTEIGVLPRDAIFGIALCLSALFFVIAVRPNAGSLALTWTSMPFASRMLILDLSGFLIAAVVWICWRREGALIRYGALVLVVPALEEILFRGYAWSRLSAIPGWARSPLAILAVSTALFGLWHIGYTDTLLDEFATLRPTPLGSLASTLAIKISSALILGLVAGFVRWRTGRTYGSVLVHAFWNLITLAP